MKKIKTFFMATLIGIGGTYEAKQMFDAWETAEDSGDENLAKIKVLVMNEHPVIRALYNLIYLITAFIFWPIGLATLVLDYLV